MQPMFKALTPKIEDRKNTKTIACANIICVEYVQSHNILYQFEERV